jgi:hypothetical protein
MRTFAMLALVVSVLGCNSAPTHRIVFQESTFILKHRSATPAEILNEYVQAKESLEHWSEMIAVRVFPELNDPSEAASNVVSLLKAQQPETSCAMWRSENGNRVAVDFITWDKERTVAEFNVFIYQTNPNGKGLLANQYAKRAYADKSVEHDRLAIFMLELKYTKKDLLTQLLEYNFPTIVMEENP